MVKIKIIIFSTVTIAASIIYAFVEYSVAVEYKIAFGALFIFLAFCYLGWGALAIKVNRHHKRSQRLGWYNKMGLLESGYFVETKHAIRYWRNLMNELLK